MSTFKVDTLQSTTGGDVTLTNQSAAKAWGQFNGTGTASISDSLNFASITDGGTGVFTFNFSTNMANAFFAANGSTGENSVNGFVRVGGTNSSNIFINSKSSTTGGVYDDSKIYISTHGDLA